MENLPFDLPHTIYINILRILKEVYHVFDKMDDDSNNTIIAKSFVVSKQQKFSKTKLKAMKVAIEQSLKEAPQVDLDAINKRMHNSLAKAIT